MFHAPLVGTPLAADKRKVAERILLVDDHPLTRDALAALLAQEGFEVVGDASSGEEAIAAAERLQPDLDPPRPDHAGHGRAHRTPEHPGGSARTARSSSSRRPTPRRTSSPRSRPGAAGYLLKTEPPEQIATFLRGVAQGEAALSGGVARRLLDRVREGGRLDGIPEEITRVLSAREVEVLLLLDEHLGTDEIAQRLFISEHTVRSHVKSLLRKLGVSSRREALERLETARGYASQPVKPSSAACTRSGSVSRL